MRVKLKRLSQRQEAILLSLKKFDYLTRDQLSAIHKLGQIRNTNRVLGELREYTSHFRSEYDTIYHLNGAGREYVGAQKVRKKTNRFEHFLKRNDFYIYSGCPQEWMNEVRVSDGTDQLITDAMFKLNNKYIFLEVDRTQSLRENKEKLKYYSSMFKRGLITKKLGYFPTVVWLTFSELRKRKLSELSQELPSQVFTFDEIK